MRGCIWLLLVVGCYAPNPQPGSPCTNGACPAPLVCSPATSTCERESVDGDFTMPDSAIDGCTPITEVCGDGVDQDCDGQDPTCPANDTASGALDITGGGTFTADLRYAHDDLSVNACGGTGGRDLYYTVTLTAPRVYYVDTFGSSFNTVVRVYAGACSDVAATDAALTCLDDACGTPQSQLAVSLPSGESCIVIDQASDAETTGMVSMNVIAGVRNGMPLPSGTSSLTGNTSNAANDMDPVDVNCDAPGADGNDLAYFFTRCPGQSMLLDAETCGGATWDTVLYVRRGNTNQIACNDDGGCGFQTKLTDVAIDSGELFWLVVDGFDETQNGSYTLVTNLRSP